MSDIIIKDATIVSMDPDRENNVFEGDIVIRNGIIENVIDNKNADEKLNPTDKTESFQEINASNFIIMPGLINTHGHAAMSLFRSYADDLPLMQWLENKIFPIEARLTEEDVYWGTLLSIVEMIKSGTTTFTDMYFFMDEVARASSESGIRAVLSRGMVGPDDEGKTRMKEIKNLYNKWDGDSENRVLITLGPHAIYTCPPNIMESICEMAHDLNSTLQIHVSETRTEVESCLKEHGGTPVEVLAETGLFEHPVICAHCVHLTENDIDILAKAKAGIAHNPGSNLKLGSGIAPLNKMLKAKLNVGLGTDGPASNNNLDMFEEMRLAALIHKGVNEDPTLVSANTALKMATSMGAEALFIPDLGMIKEGSKADLIGLSKNKAHLTPFHNIESHLVYSASGADVDLVIVNGNILMENNNLLTLDEEKIIREAEKCAARLKE